MASQQSISFRKRNDVDEIYTFPYQVRDSTLSIDNSVVMVEYQDDNQALIITGNLPGLNRYFNCSIENGRQQQGYSVMSLRK
jgi:hypothetical protein